MPRVMVVRHAKKKKRGKIYQLSSQGEADAKALGANLPRTMREGHQIKYIGGSMQLRTLHTAILIAVGAGVDEYQLLPDLQLGLGSDEQIWDNMIDPAEFDAAYTKHNGNVIKATREVLSHDDYRLLQSQIVAAIQSCENLDGNVLLVTHSPLLQILYGAVIDHAYDKDAAELDYIVLGVADGRIVVIETSLEAK